MKADNPGATFTEMAKLISERWRAIDPETKAKYDARAAKEKARYAEEMQVYKAKKVCRRIISISGLRRCPWCSMIVLLQYSHGCWPGMKLIDGGASQGP